MKGSIILDTQAILQGYQALPRNCPQNVKLPVVVLDLDLTLIDSDFNFYIGARVFMHLLSKIAVVGIWTAGNSAHLEETLEPEPSIDKVLSFKIVNCIDATKPCKFIKSLFTSHQYFLIDDSPHNFDPEYTKIFDVRKFICNDAAAVGQPNYDLLFKNIEQTMQKTRCGRSKTAAVGGGISRSHRVTSQKVYHRHNQDIVADYDDDDDYYYEDDADADNNNNYDIDVDNKEDHYMRINHNNNKLSKTMTLPRQSRISSVKCKAAAAVKKKTLLYCPKILTRQEARTMAPFSLSSRSRVNSLRCGGGSNINPNNASASTFNRENRIDFTQVADIVKIRY